MANKKLKAPVNIPVSKIHPFEGHPYKVLDNDEMNNLIESIQQKGVISPIVVRPLENTDDEYELISGHRRLRASVKAGLETVPALICAVSRDEAAIMLVDSNLHREHILPSDKAFAYKLKLEAIKRQGERTDLTSSQVATKFDSAAEIGNITGESRDKVYRYIRLTYLIPELLEMMDEDKIAFSVGVELSFLDDQMQYDLLRVIEENECLRHILRLGTCTRILMQVRLQLKVLRILSQQKSLIRRPCVKCQLKSCRRLHPRLRIKILKILC